jgi:hypothetical protein
VGAPGAAAERDATPGAAGVAGQDPAGRPLSAGRLATCSGLRTAQEPSCRRLRTGSCGLAGLALTQGRLDSAGLQLDDVACNWARGPLLRHPGRALKLQDAPLSAQLRLSPQQFGADPKLQSLQLARLSRWLPLPDCGAALQAQLSGRAGASLARSRWPSGPQRLRLTLQDRLSRTPSLGLAPAQQAALAWQSARLDQAVLDLGGHQLDPACCVWIA